MGHQKVRHLLIIGTDESIFIPGSPLSKRTERFTEEFTSVHVLCRVSAPHKTERPGRILLHPIFTPRLFYVFSAYKVGVDILRSGGRWIISAENPFEEGFVGWLLSRRFGASLQLQVHTDVFSTWYRRASWKEYLRFCLAKFLIPRVTCLRVVSKRIRNSLLQATSYKLQAKITVLPIFTDISKFLTAERDPKIEARFKDYDLKMIAVGRYIDKEKNFRMLIEMMRDFVKICPRAVLVLAGDGPSKASYQLLVTSYQLDRNVIIGPWHSDLSSFYKSFDLYLLSSNYEGWGRTVIEAMASGLPVVMTDVGLAGEVIKNSENGIIVPPADKDKFLAAVRSLYDNPDKRARLARAGQQTLSEFKPTTEEEYIALYKESLIKCGS